MMKVLLTWSPEKWELDIIIESLKGLCIDWIRKYDELREKITDIDIIITGMRPKFLECAKRLKFIQTLSAGVDQFNIDQLSKRGILLASAKGCNARAVAEHVFALILAWEKRILELSSTLKEGKWISYSKRTFLGDLEGKNMLIIGFGNIGRCVAEIAKAFNIKVFGVAQKSRIEDGVRVYTREKLKELLSIADYVVVALPLTPSTRSFIGRDELRSMKRSAFLVNVARGPVIDEKALYEALTDGWIAGAGLDVWWKYPPHPDFPSGYNIHKLPNVIATPHKAGWTKNARKKCLKFAAENVARFVRGEKPLNLVNPGVMY